MSDIGSQNGAKIRALRDERGISGVQFAERVGITRQHLHNIERRNKQAGLEVLIRIARVLKVRVDDLLRDDIYDDLDGESAAKAA